MTNTFDQVTASIECFDTQYKTRGARAQRGYPNESLVQFIFSKFADLPQERRKDVKVLELGCGSGGNLWMMAKEGFDVYGIDGSDEALNLAEKQLHDKWGVSANLQRGSFTDLPYKDKSFDVVVDVVSLQHLSMSASRQALSELARVLKPGGEFFSYRLSDHSLMFSRENEWIDFATLSNINNSALPLANNGPIAFWSPTLAKQEYGHAGLELRVLERIGRTYADGAYVEYLAIRAARPAVRD